jgi:hypothetical protein
MSVDAFLDFHPSHESGRTTQHGHTQSSEANHLMATHTDRPVQSFLIREGSWLTTFHLLPTAPTPTSLPSRPGIVQAVLLFYSRTNARLH